MDKEWEYDKYFVKQENVERQEHVIYKKRPDGRIERTTITRRYYARDDYQDSTETIIL